MNTVETLKEMLEYGFESTVDLETGKAALTDAIQQLEWRSCYNAPHNNNPVLVTDGNKVIIWSAIYDRDTCDWFFPCGVTHWLPLPLPPAPEGE